MIDLIVLSVTVGLILTSVWLYLSTEKMEAKLHIETALLPDALLRAHLVPLPPKSKVLLRRTNGKPVRVLMAVLLLSVLVLLGIYLFRTASNETLLKVALCVVGALLALAAGLLRSPTGGQVMRRLRRDIEGPLRMVSYRGLAHIPLRVYEGDSYNVTVDLQPIIGEEPFEDVASVTFRRIEDESNVSLSLSFLRHYGQQEFLELEMLAAGLTVEGDKKQQQALVADSLRYQWNCFFPNSGSHTFAIALRVTGGSGTVEIGRIEQRIRVVKIDHLTQRQVWVLATAAGIASGVLAILEATRALGLW